MRFFVSVLYFLILIAGTAKADLLERMTLEDSFRNRVKDVVRVFDPQAQVLIRFDYKSFKGDLPGTSTTSAGTLIPNNVDLDDLAKVEIKIYSTMKEFPAEVQEIIRTMLPLSPKNILLSFPEAQFFPEKVTSQEFTPKDVEKSAEKLAHDVERTALLAVLFSTIVILGGVLFLNSRRAKAASLEIDRIVQALKDSAMSPSMPVPQNSTRSSDVEGMRALGGGASAFALAGYNLESLKSMIADCYWCEKDDSAAWLWKNIEVSQRSALLEVLPFMNSYCQFLNDMPGSPFQYVEHPYYLKPLDCNGTSQTDLAELVRKESSLWGTLSPQRQAHLPLSLEEKIQCSTHSSPLKFAGTLPASSPRVLIVGGDLGDLTLSDEAMLITNPHLVPKMMRGKIKTLVWLGMMSDKDIAEKFERLDARSLASAWIGPEELLQRLESLLPAKKRELLTSYKNRTNPSKDSAAFIWLFDESLKHEIG